MKNIFIQFFNLTALFAILLISCGESQSDTVMLANNLNLKLKSDEKVVENSAEIVAFHDSVFNSYGALSWPLYKAIEGNNYRSFVGVPIEIDRSRLTKEIEKADANQLIEKFESDSTTFMKYKKGDLYVVSVIADYNQFLWTLSASSEDSSKVNFLFDQDDFKNRVSIND
jgi:hypothetical protein